MKGPTGTGSSAQMVKLGIDYAITKAYKRGKGRNYLRIIGRLWY